MTYIHQNPARGNIIEKLEDWEFSSYLDLIGKRKGTLPKSDIIKSRFKSVEEFKIFSEQLMEGIGEGGVLGLKEVKVYPTFKV